MDLREQVLSTACKNAWPINQWHAVTLEQSGQKIRVQARVNQKNNIHIRKVSISRENALIRLHFFRINDKNELKDEGETRIYETLQPELYKDLFDEIRAAFSPAACPKIIYR